MARKASKSAQGRGRNDVLGVVFFALAVLLLIALFTYDRRDLDLNSNPPNKEIQNMIGAIGARVAYAMFFIFGAAAYLLPIVFFFIGLGNLLSFLTYLRRQWVWATGLLFACMGLLDLYGSHLRELQQNLNAPSVGGIIGHAMNSFVFIHFGVIGATVVFVTFYTVSLLYLTNFPLGHWVHAVWVI